MLAVSQAVRRRQTLRRHRVRGELDQLLLATASGAARSSGGLESARTIGSFAGIFGAAIGGGGGEGSGRGGHERGGSVDLAHDGRGVGVVEKKGERRVQLQRQDERAGEF